MLNGVIQSILLYAAPVWEINKYKEMLLSVQRRSLLRVISGYRTISAAAVQAVAGVPPVDLLINERTRIYKGLQNQCGAREETMQKWQDRWTQETVKAQWTKKLIPDLTKWTNCKHRRTNYFFTQALSGHGSFKSYTNRIQKTDSIATIAAT